MTPIRQPDKDVSGAEPAAKPEAPGPARRRRWWLWALLLVVAVCAAALVVLFASLGSQASRAIAQAKKEAKARGYATSVEEILARMPAVPDEANAALVYEKAAIALEAAGGEDPTADGAPGGRYIPMVSNRLSLYHVRSTDDY